MLNSSALPRFLLLLLLPLLLAAATAPAQTAPLNATLDGYEYPLPVRYLPLNLESQALRMAYMDVPPTARANRQRPYLRHDLPAAGEL